MTTGQRKQYTEATKSGLGKETRPLSSDVLRQFAASLDLESHEDLSVETVKQLYSTYSSAQDWMNTHNSDIIVALRLLQIYPKLIQSDSASPLMKLLNPLLNLPPQSSVDAEEDTPEPLTSGRKVVYVCGHSEYVGEGITAKDRIIASLSCYCRVQTHPDPPPLEDNAEDALEEIRASDVFILILNDDTLNCWFSLYRLAGAVNFNIPIITIRDSCFELSDPLPESFYQTEILTGPNLRLDVSNGYVARESRLASSRSSGFYSACSQVKYTESSDQLSSDCCLLADVIKACYLSSMKYISKFHDSCVAKLFGKLSDYLGDFFLDLEISNSHFGSVTPDAEDENGKASVYFSKCAILRKRPTPPLLCTTNLTIGGNENTISDSSTPYSENTSSPINGNKMAKLMSRDNPFAADNDCESPFVHRTNYVVFPSRSPSSSRKSPYVVAFPDGIDNVETEETDHLVSPYGDFDNVRLDITVPLKDRDSPPISPIGLITDKTNRETENVNVKEASKKRDKIFKMSREQKLQRREPKQCTIRDSATNKKTVGRRMAKLPKINLEVHDVRMMKNHDKSRRLGKSVSL